jgi:hypothetical protein
VTFDHAAELARARRLSAGLRHQLRHGLDLLDDNHPLCEWDGPLLPLEPVDLPPIRHGTNNGYQTHLRRGIPPCPACRTAHRHQRRQERTSSAA